MKYSRILAALVAVTFVACTKKKSEDAPAYPVIPQDVTFDKSTLEPISDQEFNSTFAVLKAVNSLTSFEDQLATKFEDDDSRREREEEFNKMTPAQQAIVLRKQNDCTVDEDKKEADFGSDLKAGQNTTGFETAHIYGPNCGSDSSKNANTLLSVLAFDQSALTLDLGTKGSISLKTEITNQADAAVLGYSYMDANIQAESRSSGSFFAQDTYMHGSGNVLYRTVQASELLVNLDMEILARKDRSSVSKIVMILDVQGKRTQVTMLSSTGAGGAGETEEIYFGNRLLTAQEKADLGKIKLTQGLTQK